MAEATLEGKDTEGPLLEVGEGRAGDDVMADVTVAVARVAFADADDVAVVDAGVALTTAVVVGDDGAGDDVDAPQARTIIAAATRAAVRRAMAWNGAFEFERRGRGTMGSAHRSAGRRIGRSPGEAGQLEIHQIADVIRRQSECGSAYLEFQRSADLSTGLYVLPAGGTDGQSPHAEDEIYYVLGGRSRVTVGDDEASVGPGAVIFVAAGVPHRFHDITEDLQLLVVFGPAEGSRANEAQTPGAV